MSSPKFHSLRVSDIVQETDDCVSVAFEVPESLKTDFAFHAGQYLTIKKNIEGEELRRSYSICSAPFEKELRVAIKQVKDGRFSTYANHSLNVGDQLEVMTPMGNFTPGDHNSAEAVNYFGFASGSGITPMLSIIQDVLHKNTNSTFTLVYGNKNVKSIIFKEQLEALKNKHLNRLQIIHVLSRERIEAEINFGRINREKCEQVFSKLLDIHQIDEAFICGPEEMILGVKDYLIEQGVDAKKVKFELFNTPVQGSKQQSVDEESTDGESLSKVSIKVDDRTFEIELAKNGKSILDAALDQGADLPFACKGGVCCTCRAKVVEGEVKMRVNYALEPDEVANGFILSCQAHPVSEKVIVDFDVR